LTSSNEKDFDLLQTCGAEEVLQPHKMAATNFYNDHIKALLS